MQGKVGFKMIGLDVVGVNMMVIVFSSYLYANPTFFSICNL